MTTESGLARWARRKAQAQGGAALAVPEPVASAPLPPTPVLAVEPAPAQALPVAAEPAPTLADVALLTRESDYARFVAPGVDEGVKRAALKKLFFGDPHFNRMDGLDTYIDDYGRPDPIPLAMLRQLNQSKLLRLFDEEAHADASPTPSAATTDEDPDLRLQQDDATGRAGPDPGAGA